MATVAVVTESTMAPDAGCAVQTSVDEWLRWGPGDLVEGAPRLLPLVIRTEDSRSGAELFSAPCDRKFVAGVNQGSGIKCGAMLRSAPCEPDPH